MIDPHALIAARKAAGLSQPQLANLAKCSQQLIAALEAGTTKTTKFLPRIAAVLNVLPGVLDEDFAGLTSVDGPIAAQPTADRVFPVYASAEGGPGEVIRSADPMEWVPRPDPVLHVKQAYGMKISGESMVPEYRPGDTAIVNPLLPIIGGEVYIFYHEIDGEARATIKELRRATTDVWHVRQHNPPDGKKADFTLNRKEWAICHRVIGKYSRQ